MIRRPNLKLASNVKSWRMNFNSLLHYHTVWLEQATIDINLDQLIWKHYIKFYFLMRTIIQMCTCALVQMIKTITKNMLTIDKLIARYSECPNMMSMCDSTRSSPMWIQHTTKHDTFFVSNQTTPFEFDETQESVGQMNLFPKHAFGSPTYPTTLIKYKSQITKKLKLSSPPLASLCSMKVMEL